MYMTTNESLRIYNMVRDVSFLVYIKRPWILCGLVSFAILQFSLFYLIVADDFSMQNSKHKFLSMVLRGNLVKQTDYMAANFKDETSKIWPLSIVTAREFLLKDPIIYKLKSCTSLIT